MAALVRELFALTSTLEEHGLLNSNLARAYEMKQSKGSMYFLELVLMFCDRMEAAMRELAFVLERPDVDYEFMFEYYIKIKGSATRIGACRLGLAVEDLRNAIRTTCKERFHLAVLRMQEEYQILRPHLVSIVELERRIVRL